MWLPDWLYERLPFIHIGCALLCLWIDFRSPAAAGLSAGMFFGAALLTHLRRRAARDPSKVAPSRTRAH